MKPSRSVVSRGPKNGPGAWNRLPVISFPQDLRPEPIMPQNRGQRSPIVLLTLALMAAAQPARAAPTTVAEIATYTGPDRAQMLEAGARREGTVMLYAPGTQIQPLLDRFMQIYPFVKVTMPRASAIDVSRKVIEE